MWNLEDYARCTELSAESRTLVRMMQTLTEELQTVAVYEARLSLEENNAARSVLMEAQKEEVRHMGMSLQFVLRAKPQWRAMIEGLLSAEGAAAPAPEELPPGPPR